MIAYLLRSFAQAIVVMLAVALIAFAMFRFVGDPIANMVGQEASVAERQ
ncbi:MAG: ABC transporter permease, partial [Alphaproteobacteria bacterium]|nr:ABC transporter permease [Alphaproteobacteria bacterium]